MSKLPRFNHVEYAMLTRDCAARPLVHTAASGVLSGQMTTSFLNFTEGHILLKERTQTIKNKIKLYILGVPVHKLGN